jgi:hypothetical protein
MGIKFAAGLLKARPFVTGEITGVFITGEESAVLVGASNNAIAAADTDIVIDVDDAVRPFLGGFGGAYLDTGGFFTLVAADGNSGELLSGYISFPGDQARPVHTEGQEVLDPAGGHAGVAAGTFYQVDYHAPSHDRCS